MSGAIEAVESEQRRRQLREGRGVATSTRPSGPAVRLRGATPFEAFGFGCGEATEAGDVGGRVWEVVRHRQATVNVDHLEGRERRSREKEESESVVVQLYISASTMVEPHR